MNTQFELTEIKQIIFNCNDVDELIEIYSRYKNYPHPEVSHIFSVIFLNNEMISYAKDALIKGMSHGIKYPCPFYDNFNIDYVAQCLFSYVTKFPITNKSTAFKIISLCYIYFSRCIELYPDIAYDSYRSRGFLFTTNYNQDVLIQFIFNVNADYFFKLEPYIISDFYYSFNITLSPHKDLKDYAIEYHKSMENEAVDGKDANEYSLAEMAELGKKRHNILYNKAKERYLNGEFNITTEELKELQ